jgi:hypothetical protein
LQLANGRGEHLVRFYDRRANEFQNDMLGPMTAIDAGTVLDAIKADMADRPDVHNGYHYQLALTTLEMLARPVPALEVVFDQYMSMRVGQ